MAVAVVAGVGSGQSATYAQLDLVEAGSHAVAKQKVLVYNLQNFPADSHLQGILGEDFLEHFDLLIDNAHRLLCLDDSAAMRAEVKGPHIPLVAAAEADRSARCPLCCSLRRVYPTGCGLFACCSTSARTSPSSSTPLNTCCCGPRTRWLSAGVVWMERSRSFRSLPPQDVKIGSLELPGVPFFSTTTEKDSFVQGFDGVLTTGLFRRVFIDHADRFAVLEPR